MKRFELWLSSNAPRLLPMLNEGATLEQIQWVEQSLEVKFPTDVVECYRIHNGQDSDADYMFNGTEFLSLERMVDEWKIWKDLLDGGDFADSRSTPAPEIKDSWWNAQWIPFTYNGAGDHYCIDLDPTAEETVGQIITMWHDDSERALESKNFVNWFADYVLGLENGLYVYSEEEYGAIVDKDDVFS